MNKQGQQEQEIFQLQTHAGVGQDKATPPRRYAASDQPFNATTPAYRDRTTPPKKHHGSQKRRLREVAGCVPQQTVDEISSEFGEKRNFRSNLTHVVRILQQSGKSPQNFTSYLYEARSITKQQGSVKKQMPHFFRVLEDIVGIQK